MRKGIAVSPGVAVGTAYCIHQIFVSPDSKRLEDEDVTAELAKYETARDEVAAELVALQTKVEQQVGSEEANVFRVHEAILRDTAFTKKVRNWIVSDRTPIQAALQRLLAEYSDLFSSMTDPYLKERLSDVRDVIIRLSANLSEVLHPVGDHTTLTGPLIIVADELLPSQVVQLGKVDVQGIVTEQGSQTSHAAIIARSRGIPAVSGVHGILKEVKTGDTIVVDGREGVVAINPDAETVAAYSKLQREFFDLQDQLAVNHDLPAKTADGTDLQVLANINSLSDCNSAEAMGASGIGLYRTEYLYLTHPDVPDEDEQATTYLDIIRASPNQQITIRTLDIGGDKTISYLGHGQQDANPFMGWRSIRLSFEHPEFFKTQLKSILRAAGQCPDADVRIMFPMITTREEMVTIRQFADEAISQLVAENKPHREVPMGIMLEVPAAALAADLIMDVADFVSIGSNDLIQYLMAADRDNPKVNHLCQPLSPAVIRVLVQVVQSCNRLEKPVTLCGEMAGQPSAFFLLLGMGLRQFSMSPAFIPTIKKLASLVTIGESETMLEQSLELKTTDQVKSYMNQKIKEIAPDLAILNTT